MGLHADGNTERHAVRLGTRLDRGLAVSDAARFVGARMNADFGSVDDMWRRPGVPAASLVERAEADAFRPAVNLKRRDALWAIKMLRDEPLPLFAAAAALNAHLQTRDGGKKSCLRQYGDFWSDLSLAQTHALNLARTLVVPVTLFEINRELGVMPSAEYRLRSPLLDRHVHQRPGRSYRPCREPARLKVSSETTLSSPSVLRSAAV
jgi:hypothetical protein